MNLEKVENTVEEGDLTGIEKKATKRTMTAKQLENLAAGRAKRQQMKEERIAAAPPKQVKPVAKVETEIVNEKPKAKRKKQVIVFDDNSESEDDAPQIIIKQKRTQKQVAVAAPPAPPPSPPASPPAPLPIPRLRRV